MRRGSWFSPTHADWAKRSFRLMFIAGLLLLFPDTGVSDTLYVSPDGDDANPGTQSQPLRTLQGARDRVRNMDKNRTEDVVVLFKAGDYFIDEHRPLRKGRLGCQRHIESSTGTGTKKAAPI